MKRPLLLIPLCFIALTALAQRPLTNSINRSRYTYIYPLSDTGVRLFYSGNQKKIDNRILFAPLDSFAIGHYKAWNLPAGNYMEVYAGNNQLHYELIEKRSAYLKLINDDRELKFIVLDGDDHEVKDAIVHAGSRSVNYDDDLNYYHHITRHKKDSLLNISYKGVSNFYKVKPGDQEYRYRYVDKRSWFKKFWAKLTLPFRILFVKQKVNKYTQPTINQGYMVFNKPKYKPADTVKLKAFILTPNKFTPVADTRLAVRLKTNYNDRGKILGYVNAYHAGGFEYSFKLADSLKLQLDRSYTISLETADNLYDPEKQYEQYLKHCKVYIQGNFQYEDYELTSSKFTVRADKTEHAPGQPAALYFKATDENSLDIPDGRVTVTLKTSSVTQFGAQHVFVPDTLWQHTLNLDPVGETKLLIPDFVFPKARISYSAQVVLLTSNNERREETKYLTYTNERYQIIHQLINDTLKLDYLQMGKSTAAKAMLYRLNDNEDTLSRNNITLPARFVIDPAIANYVVVADSLEKEIKTETLPPPLYASAVNSGDSLKISIANPAHLQFWYTVFDRNKVIDKGSVTTLNYHKAVKSKTATVIVNYIWAGKMQSQQVVASFKDKELVIDVKAPQTVYPGQQADISIHVNDAKGKPVTGADVTAYAFTSKFENYPLPNVPNLSKVYPGYTAGIPLQINELESTGTIKLNWQRWSKQMGLDTIEYYKFTHPAQIYAIEEPTPDSTTQIAPFVIKDGDIIPVHILYVDGIPVYFSKTNDLQHYSFMVNAGKHNLSFRTTKQNITLNEVAIKAKNKLILSVNADTVQNKKARFIAMPDTLTNYEADLINKYLISIVPNFGERLATITQNGRIFLLSKSGNNNQYVNGRYNYRPITSLLVGPLATNFLNFTVKGQDSRYFLTEPGYSFQFDPGLIKQKLLPTKYPFTKELANTFGDTDYRQYALTPKAVDTLWRNYLDQRSHTRNVSVNNYSSTINNGQLTVNIDKKKDGQALFVRSVIVYKNDDPDYVQIFAGNSTNLGYYPPGKYRVLYLFKGNTYFLQDNIIIKPYGHNYYSTGAITFHQPDSVSLKIAGIIDGYEPDQYNGQTIQQVKEVFNEKYLDQSSLVGEMSGYVYAKDDKMPLPGVSIRVRGIQAGTVTDANGFFKLQVPNSGHLVFSFIGYTSEEVQIHPGQQIKLFLNASTSMLQEVVITGYGSQKRSNLAGSVTYMTDTVEYRASSYKVRGNATLDELLKKMEGIEVGATGSLTHQGQAITKIRLNGKDYAGGDIALALKNLPADVITNMQMIDDYGDQAAITGIKNGDPKKILSIITDQKAFDTALQGRVAGVQVMLRGNSSLSGAKPIVVIDGVIYTGDFDKLDQSTIGDITVLNSASAINMYGAQAAQGAVIIQTKKNMLAETANANQQQSIRKNFSDYAYWQPKLITDAQGNVSFKTTFPDDITNWKTFFIGMTGNRQSGAAVGQIKSYKPLSANFTPPQFAVKGDVFNPIGKIMNYTTDTVHLKRTFKFNNELLNEKGITLKNALIDTFKVTAAGKDSLTFEYTVKKASGYFDGERRAIPLFEQGSLETKGIFVAMEKDTTITIKLDPQLKEATFHAEASLLPVLLDETEHLRNYEYLCNEQLASKLDGLLTEKKIRTYLTEPFKYDKDINYVIKKLQDSRRAQGTWGWWKDTDEELWISLHVTDALLNAEALGFKIQLDKAKLTDYLLYQATAYKGEDKLTVMLLLRKLGAARPDYDGFVKEYLKQLDAKHPPSLYNKLRLMLVQQQMGKTFNQDSLLKEMHQTMFGNVYWGHDSYNFFDNSVQESLIAYQLLKTEGKHPELLAKLRNYFLEQRKDGYWRNTYESAQIMETILPDLLVEGKKPEPSVITLSGNKNETVTQFPYTTTLSSGAGLTVKKTGTMPVYITAYQQFWNPQPEKVSKDFTVDTRFEKNSQTVTNAKGGETITLQVEVNARADAGYVMVEIPIPAGCSYLNKNQSYGNGEVHREYFKNKVSIFCRKLTPGKHLFTVSLTARYGGIYRVNPAKAELMYFPVFYGREGMKVFEITGN